MLIICPSCATSYEVQPNTLPPHGQVRCQRCSTVWSPLLYQAGKLLAAAAAVAADFTFQNEASPPEDRTKQPEPEGDIAAPDSIWGPSIAEIAMADAVADSCTVAEIIFVDAEPNHFSAVTANATANLLPALSMVAEVETPDSKSAHAVACEYHAGFDLNVAPIALAPPNERSQRSVNETQASGYTVGMVADGELLPVDLFAEADESSADCAVEVFEEEPSTDGGPLAVMSDEARDAAWQCVEECSVDMISAKLEAALSEQVEFDACERPVVLRADDYGKRSSENAEDIQRGTASRSRREAEIQARSLNIPVRRFIPRWPLSNLHTGIVALALLDVFLVGWRTDIVRRLPQTASFYALAGLPVNLRGLAFENITTSTVRDDGTPVLVVEGNVTNDTRKNVRVPEIRFVVRDAAAQEIYSWTASAARTSLPPGQAATFRTRLASPPPAAHDVVLRFVGRSDAIAINR